jgi:hypothetical protein
MSLSAAVKKQFGQNTNYSEAHQLVNQAASLKYLSSDLYRDSKRFIYELLQNADDSSVDRSKVKVAIRLFGDKLVIAHTGKGFDSRDVRGISSVDDGTKKDAPDKTGFKGIGFKSVFGQSDQVVVYSEGEYFRFDAGYTHEWKPAWGPSQAAWEEEDGRKFEMPWQLIPIFTEAGHVAAEINEFLTAGGWKVGTIISLRNVAGAIEAIGKLADNVNMFLFLKNIQSILIYTDAAINIEIREMPEHQTLLVVNNEEKARWLKRTVTLDVPAETKARLAEDKDVPEKLQKTNKVDITLAAKITDKGIEALDAAERLLYAYLPTEENGYNIPVLVNAAFYTVANRETLHKESPWNEWIFQCIPTELFKWIAELVQAGQYDSYNLLPVRLSQGDHLATAYNTAFTKAIEEIPFIINTNKQLLKVREAIIDFTFLSEKQFIGREAVKNFLIADKGLTDINENPFVSNIGFGTKLKKIGVVAFEWGQLPALLKQPGIMSGHTTQHNIALISHLKNISENERVTDVTDAVLKSWPFILNHKNELKSPKDVFFPSADDVYDATSDLSFIHPDLQSWLNGSPAIKDWLERLGVVEKSDLTYLEKTIIPNAGSYVTKENAIDTIRKIFNLYLKEEIGVETIKQLSSIKLLTEQNSLIPANECYLSADYRPRLVLQSILKEDIYLSKVYISEGTTYTQWKGFFLLMGVNEGIDIIRYEKRLSNDVLIEMGFSEDYFDHKFSPFINTFTGYAYKDLYTLALSEYTLRSIEFARLFWKDVVEAMDIKELEKPATAFWGRSGFPGNTTGDEVSNYPKWFVANMACLPATTGECLNSKVIFLNETETIKIAGKYLPVFDGPELNADWRAFFSFKPRLEMEDYLHLLTKIAEDPTGDNKIRTQSIYEYLLDNYHSWNAEKQNVIVEWAKTGKLADSLGTYRATTDLKYYADGDFTIFGNSYSFIQLGKTAQRHPDIDKLLGLFQVSILRQSEFKLNISDDLRPSALKDKLEEVIPYWAKWMEKERQGGYEEMLYDLQWRFNDLEILEATELNITYGEDWQKKVTVHHLDNTLYVLDPWSSAKVMYALPDKLCEIFQVKKYSNEIAYLLKSTIPEIKEHFEEEGIGLPPLPEETTANEHSPSQEPSSAIPDFDFSPKTSTDYEHYWNESVKRNAQLVEEFGSDPQALLINGLTKEQPDGELKVYHFSHIENAVSIIRETAIKSRRDAVFKDSAGSGIIAQTDADRKVFARFYFRTKTPTQYYIENLGRGAESIARIGSDPLCPVPVFFVIPLEGAMEQSDWSISIGSLASPQVKFGNDTETISKFDFDGVYKNLPEVGRERFLIAAHQEFLVKEELDLSNLAYHLAVQDENAKACLLAMLGDDAADWEARIFVDVSLYNQENPKVNIEISGNTLNASLSSKHSGFFMLQHSANQEWEEITGQIDKQYNGGGWITTFSGSSISIKGNLENIRFKIFYCYKGRTWLIHTNTDHYGFDIEFVKAGLEEWFASPSPDVAGLFNALKAHPELAYWFERPVGGPDGLSLEQHTTAVIDNYMNYFEGRQKVFSTEKEYLFCLALHDIGKPAAVVEGNRHLQHSKTLEIIKRLREVFPVNNDTLQKMEVLVNADPIGKYLNPAIGQSFEESCDEILAMSKGVAIDFGDFLETLVSYYQCDAAGYNSLRKRLFLTIEDDKLAMTEDGSRLLFNEEYETKFKPLFDTVELL